MRAYLVPCLSLTSAPASSSLPAAAVATALPLPVLLAATAIETSRKSSAPACAPALASVALWKRLCCAVQISLGPCAVVAENGAEDGVWRTMAVSLRAACCVMSGKHTQSESKEQEGRRGGESGW